MAMLAPMRNLQSSGVHLNQTKQNDSNLRRIGGWAISNKKIMSQIWLICPKTFVVNIIPPTSLKFQQQKAPNHPNFNAKSKNKIPTNFNYIPSFSPSFHTPFFKTQNQGTRHHGHPWNVPPRCNGWCRLQGPWNDQPVEVRLVELPMLYFDQGL